MGKGTNTVTQNSAPPPQVLANYADLVNQAKNVASAPYQPYQGQIVPDLNMQQINAMAALSGAGNVAPQYYNQAQGYLNQSASPINISNANTSQYVSPYAQAGAAGAMGAGQGLANYGINAGNNVAGYAYNIGQQGPQLQQFNSQNVGQYLNPYTQNVIDTTSANIDRSNAIQQNSLTGSAIQAGNAFGGDRAGVAAAELARNQALAKNQTIAGLESQGYSQALGQFNTSNQQALAGQQTALGGLGQGAQLGIGAQQAGGQLGLAGAQLGTSATQNAQQLALAQQQAQNASALNAGNSFNNLGQAALNSYLQSAGAGLQAGTLQQQQSAAQLNVPYQQYLQSQQYPFQTTGWLGNIVQGVGSNSGGNSSTTSPAPSAISQIGNLGLAGVGAYGMLNNAGMVGGLGAGFNAATTAAASGMTAAELAGLTGEGVDTAAAAMAMLPFGAKQGGRIGYDDGGSVDDDNSDGLNPLVQYNAFQNAAVSARNANADARHIEGYAAGGLTGAQPDFSDKSMPFANSGVAGLIPNLQPLKVGQGIGIPSAPSPYQNQDMANLNKNIQVVSSAFKHANGGLVAGKFADGGSFDDRFGAAFPNQQTDADVINPGDPMRLDPDATDRWRKSADFLLNHSDAASPGVTGAPPPAEPPAQPPSQPPMQRSLPSLITAGASNPNVPETDEAGAVSSYLPEAKGVAGVPPPGRQAALDAAMAANAHGGLQNFTPPHRTADPWLALMAAGFAGAASRNPQPLAALGEAGLAGLKNYTDQQKELDEMDQHPIIDHSGPTIRIYYPSTRQWFDTGIPTMTASQQAQNVESKRQRDLQERQMIETERHNKASEDKEFAAKVFPEVNQDTGEMVYKVFDPKTKKMIVVTPEGAAVPAAIAPLKSGEFDYRRDAPHLEKGDKVPDPQKVPGKSADTLKADAEYFLATGTLPKASISGKKDSVLGMNYQNAVKNYANAVALSRGETPESIADMRKFGPQAVRFVLGKQGDQTVSLGTSIRHLDSLREYAEAWKQTRGSDSPLLRQAAAKFAQAWGSSEPTNLQAAARIAAPEVIKAIGVAGAGTGGERFEQEKGFQPGASNEQIFGAINVAQQFLAGQLPAKEAQANALHFPHEKFVQMVGPREYARLEALRKEGASSTTQAAPSRKLFNGKWYIRGPNGEATLDPNQ